MDQFDYCILNDNDDFINYEKGLYKAFYKDENLDWLPQDYTLLENNRLRSKIPYEDQIIYCIKDKNKIICGTAVNMNSDNDFQLEQRGFEIEKDETVCEGLNLFMDENIPENTIDLFVNLGNLLVDDLKAKNKKIVYATAPRKLKSLYQFLGFTVIDRKKIDGETELLLKFDLYDIRLRDYDL